MISRHTDVPQYTSQESLLRTRSDNTSFYSSQVFLKHQETQHVEKRTVLLPTHARRVSCVWQWPTWPTSTPLAPQWLWPLWCLVLLPAVYQFKRRGSPTIRRHRLPSSEFFIRQLSS